MSKTTYKIALLPGDGIGPEVCDEAVKVLNCVGKKFNVTFDFKLGLVGGAAYEKHKNHLPAETLKICEEADSILFGSVGGPVDFPASEKDKWHDAEKNSLLGLRKKFDLAINVRPAKVYPFLSYICPLKEERVKDGVDVLIIRELVSGIYFGKKSVSPDGKSAEDIMYYHRDEIIRPIKFAIEAARKRNKRVTVVDKANVLETSRLWRRVTKEFSDDPQYKDITFDYMYVDNAAMQLVTYPGKFDVIVTSNMFGDILSDIGSTLPGSLGLMPTASMGSIDKIMMFEPAGGSAPDIAGKGIANPIAQILSAAWMLRYQFNMEAAAKAIEDSVEEVLKAGILTGELVPKGSGIKSVNCKQMGDAICNAINHPGSTPSAAAATNPATLQGKAQPVPALINFWESFSGNSTHHPGGIKKRSKREFFGSIIIGFALGVTACAVYNRSRK